MGTLSSGRAIRRVGAAMACLLVVGACTDEGAEPAQRNVVTDSGFSVRLGDAIVSASAGVAPVGTPVEVDSRPAEAGTAAVPAEWSGIVRDPADGLDVRLGDQLQPETAVTLVLPASEPPFPDATAAIVQLSDDGNVDLLPARYDPGSGAMTAEARHLSSFWPTWLDPRPFFDGIADTLYAALGLTTPKPACTGQPVESNTVGEISLPQVYRGGGDGTVWPCLEVVEGPPEQLILRLQSNSGLPYRVRATGEPDVRTGGTLDLAQAGGTALYDTLLRSPDYSEQLLIPTGSLTLTWPTSALPVDVALKADALTHLAFVGAVAVTAYLGSRGNAAVETVEMLDCLSAVVEAAVPNEDDRGLAAVSVGVAGALIGGVIDCASTLVTGISGAARFLLDILAGAAGLFFAAIQGIALTVTGQDQVSFRLAASGPPTPVLTPDGIGALRFGMTVGEAEAALGTTLPDDGSSCRKSPVLPGLVLAEVQGRIVAAAMYSSAGNFGEPGPFETDTELTLADPLSDLLAAYPDGLSTRVSEVDAGTTLYVFTGPSGRSLVFHVGQDSDGTEDIDGITAGEYLSEPCAG